MFTLLLRSFLATLVGICVMFGHAFSGSCWETLTPEDIVGFDFEIVSVVDGPDEGGFYTYTYTIYRHDQGIARYRDVSHISLWFPCKIAAQKSIQNGKFGIEVMCSEGGCPIIEMGGTCGMCEPVLDDECRSFWGIKLDECGNSGGRFLLPNLDEVTYPEDASDPHCVIAFRSSAEPELSKWLIKGGDGKSGLYDAGDIRVPTCAPAVSTDQLSWGTVKVLYR